MGMDIYVDIFFGVDFGEYVNYEDKEEFEEEEDCNIYEWETLYLRKLGKADVSYEEKRKIIDDLGIELYTGGTYDYPQYCFGIKESHIRAGWGITQIKNPHIFNQYDKYPEWTKKLKDFFEFMGIKGRENDTYEPEYNEIKNPGWYVTCMYSH
jgi:hypothetical protein